MIRTVLANVLLVGLERNIAMPQESITFNSKKYQIENIEEYKEKDTQHDENKKTKYKNSQRRNIMRRTQSIEKETKKQ